MSLPTNARPIVCQIGDEWEAGRVLGYGDNRFQATDWAIDYDAEEPGVLLSFPDRESAWAHAVKWCDQLNRENQEQQS